MTNKTAQELRALAEDVRDWVNPDFWPEDVEPDDDDFGISVVGSIDEEGNKYPIAVIDADTYGHDGESLKLAKFYAAANPAAVLTLLDRIDQLEAERDKLLEDQRLCMQEASSLARSMFKQYYSQEPDYASGQVVWGLCDSVRGVLSQIDNMATGLVRKPEEQLAQRQVPADGWVMVPREFVAGFNTLAHNYSLTVIPPDRYWGTERDAFRNAYAQCGADLAVLKAMLAASPTPPLPLKRKPLSDQQIEALPVWTNFVGLFPEVRQEIVRAIEAAAEFKGEDDGNQ